MASSIWLCGRTSGRKILLICCILACAALILALTGAGAAAAEKTPPLPGEAATCAACHAEPASQWALTPHRRTVGAPHLPEERQGCGGCHQGTDEHLEDPTAYQPVAARETAKENADLCLDCHKGGKQSLWRFSKHSRLKQACNTCHDPHNPDSRYMLREEEPDLCGECHPQQIAEGRLPSHHPIAEGKMVCSDCHNVHGDQRGNLGRETNAEMCYRCHAEKQGPFTHEHPPVTEDCGVCHRPHGSPNDSMLQVEQPLLCLQCHPGHHDGHRTPIVALDPNNPDQTLAGINSFYVKCTSCHSLIHGTDLSSGTDNGTFMPGRPASAASSTEANRGAGILGITGLTLLGNLMEGAGMEYFGFSEPWTGIESGSGSQQFVREYDGKSYERAQVDSSHRLVREHDILSVRTQNLGADDQEVDLYYANPRTSMDVNYQELTHRLGRYDFFPDTTIPRDLGRTQAVTHGDQTNGFNEFGIDRAAVEARMSYRTPKAPNVRWNLGYWAEREKGRRQFLFLDRCGACHKVATSQTIDRATSELDLGADFTLGSSSLSYSHQMRKFENLADEQFYTFSGLSSMYSGSAPLFGVADAVSTYDELRFQMPASESLYLSGLYRRGDRTNRFSDINLGIESAGGGVAYFLRDDLQLTASHFSSTLNTEAEEGVDRSLRASRAELNYFGISDLDLSLGFRREKVERNSEFALTPRSSESDIWTASGDWRPGSRFNLRAQYRSIDTDNSANEGLTAPVDFLPSRYIGRPNEGEHWQILTNYLASSRTTLTGIYSSVQDDWEVSEFGASSRGYQDITTAGLSLAYLPTSKARLTAGYYRQEGETESEVTYGVEDFILAPAGTVFPLIESTANYDYDARVLMLRGDYRLDPRWRIFGSLYQTQTDGQVLARNLGDYIDQDPDTDDYHLTLNPFDITIFDWWLGLGYDLDANTEMTLSYQFREWENDDSSIQDGDLRIWRLGVRRRF